MFASNVASNAAGGFGGAIYENGTVSPDGLTIRGTTFVSNRAAFRGGAVADDGTGVLTVIGDAFGTSTPTGNNGGQQGGAFYDSSISCDGQVLDPSAHQATRHHLGGDPRVEVTGHW